MHPPDHTHMPHTQLVLAIMYIRYKHIHEHYKESTARVTCCNTLGIVIGVLSVLGMLIVGSFQVCTYSEWLEWRESTILIRTL